MPDPHVTYLGQTAFRAAPRQFGIRQPDRLSHLYILGQTGVGKSTLLEQLARQDAEAGRGFAIIDPHGDLVERLHVSLTPEQRERVVYFDPADANCPFGYNPLRRVRQDKIPLAASGLMETFKKLWPDAWGVRMEHVLRNSLYALLEHDGSTLPDILRLYSEKAYRRSILAGVSNPVVRAYWKTEFANYPPRYAAEALAPIQNKLGALLADPMLHRVFVAPMADLRLRQMMDDGRILIVNLSKGRMGSDSALALGSFLVSTIGLAGISRAELAPADRRPFFLYVDEFQNFTTLSFANMMAELRKFGVGLTLANQHLAQLEPDIRHAVLGNAGTLISFRVGAEDAGLLARELQPVFGVEDLLNLPNRRFYLRLMIDGTPSKPFSARTIEQGLSGRYASVTGVQNDSSADSNGALFTPRAA